VNIAKKGGEVEGIARKAPEERTGRPVITSQSSAQLNAIINNLIEDVNKTDK